MLTAPTRRLLVLGALAGATALIALTARMQTGRSHAVIATAEAPQAIADLNGVPSLALLPDGGTLSLDLQSPTEVDASTVQIDAAIALTPAASPSQALVFTLDFSSSTFTTPGGCGGDFNSDGLTDTVLDCELAAALDTIQRAGDWGVAEVGISIFETIGQSADVRPQGGSQRFTAPDADLDADGVLDLETVLRSAGQFPGCHFADRPAS